MLSCFHAYLCRVLNNILCVYPTASVLQDDDVESQWRVAESQESRQVGNVKISYSIKLENQLFHVISSASFCNFEFDLQPGS